MTRALALSLSMVASMTLAVEHAHAGPDEELKSRNLFKQAESLSNIGRWKEACHLYQATHDLNSTGGTALRTADCYEKTADYERALIMYQWVVDHRDSDKLQERVKLAEGRVFALKKQLAKDASQGPLPPPTAQQQRGPVQQTAPGAPTQPPFPPPAPPPVPNRVPAFVTIGVGGASLIAGVVLGSLALVQAGDINDRCGGGDTCTPPKGTNYQKPQYDADMSAYNAKAWGANIAVGVGVVGLAVGVTLLALKIPKVTPKVKSAVGPQGLTLRF